jgi:hypothetical protein
MSRVLRTTIPQILVIIVALIVWGNYFIQNPTLKTWSGEVSSWAVVIAGATLIAGIISLTITHGKVIQKPPSTESLFLSVVLLAGMFITIGIGQGFGIGSVPYKWIFNWVFYALWVVLWSFPGFFLFTTTFRAMRVRNIETLLFTLGGVLVMMRLFPLADLIHPEQSRAGTWVLNVVNAGAVRGIYISVAIGFIGLAVRTMLGRERRQFGG